MTKFKDLFEAKDRNIQKIADIIKGYNEPTMNDMADQLRSNGYKITVVADNFLSVKAKRDEYYIISDIRDGDPGDKWEIVVDKKYGISLDED